MAKTITTVVCNTCGDIDVSGKFVEHMMNVHPGVDRKEKIPVGDAMHLCSKHSAIAIRCYTTKEGVSFTVTKETTK